MIRCPQFWAVLALLCRAAKAQAVVSATAAWSSQIVAFWGAIIIAVGSYQFARVTNGFSSLHSGFLAFRRTAQISKCLLRNNWFLHSGWKNGKIRTDIAVIYWRSPGELCALARRVAMQIEVYADDWEVLVVGRQLRNSTTEGAIRWIKSPRWEGLCGSKVKETDENMFPISANDFATALTDFQQNPSVPIHAIVQQLFKQRDLRGTRCTFLSEMLGELGAAENSPSWSNTFTSVDRSTNPFMSLERLTAQYGDSGISVMNCATRMYCMVHLMVCFAIGLMGAASGRGLAVWLMAARPTLRTLGAQDVNGCDIVASLFAIDGSQFQYEAGDGSTVLAGDITSQTMPWWKFLAVYIVPFMEVAIVIAGWLYGALHTEKLKPSGVVGHGMLALSTLVGLSLSIRALVSLRSRLSGRLVGFWRVPHFIRITIGVRSLEVSVDAIMGPAVYSKSILALIATILRDCSDNECTIAECAMRLPITGSLLQEHVVGEVLQYQYSGDHIISMGDPPKPVTVSDNYPWFQTACCIVITMLCTCISVVYSYCALPAWVKILTEILSATSATWFATLDRVKGFKHNQDTYISFMVATLVTSSVWYVGVKDIS